MDFIFIFNINFPKNSQVVTNGIKYVAGVLSYVGLEINLLGPAYLPRKQVLSLGTATSALCIV